MMALLHMEFFQNALLVGLLLSLLMGILSFFVVTKKLVFLGSGIAHTTFGGIALGLLLHWDPFFTAMAFCILSAFCVARLVRHGNVSYDTGIGIFFSFSMALGALLIALRRIYTFDLTGYLFGNILGVNRFDVLRVLIVGALFLLFLLVFLKRILFTAFDERVARVCGVRTAFLESFILVFLAVVIVVSIKLIGIVLVSAMIVLPASFGFLISRHYPKVILFSILFMCVTMISGLFLSYALDTPAGATVVVLGTVIYFLGLVLKTALQ